MSNTNRLFKENIAQLVKLRKYEVDIPKLQKCLRNHKKEKDTQILILQKF